MAMPAEKVLFPAPQEPHPHPGHPTRCLLPPLTSPAGWPPQRRGGRTATRRILQHSRTCCPSPPRPDWTWHLRGTRGTPGATRRRRNAPAAPYCPCMAVEGAPACGPSPFAASRALALSSALCASIAAVSGRDAPRAARAGPRYSGVQMSSKLAGTSEPRRFQPGVPAGARHGSGEAVWNTARRFRIIWWSTNGGQTV